MIASFFHSSHLVPELLTFVRERHIHHTEEFFPRHLARQGLRGRTNSLFGRGYITKVGCGAAQVVVRRLAVRQARVRISARHPRETLY